MSAEPDSAHDVSSHFCWLGIEAKMRPDVLGGDGPADAVSHLGRNRFEQRCRTRSRLAVGGDQPRRFERRQPYLGEQVRREVQRSLGGKFADDPLGQTVGALGAGQTAAGLGDEHGLGHAEAARRAPVVRIQHRQQIRQAGHTPLTRRPGSQPPGQREGLEQLRGGQLQQPGQPGMTVEQREVPLAGRPLPHKGRLTRRRGATVTQAVPQPVQKPAQLLVTDLQGGDQPGAAAGYIVHLLGGIGPLTGVPLERRAVKGAVEERQTAPEGPGRNVIPQRTQLFDRNREPLLELE